MSLFEVKYASERKMNKYGIYDLDVFEYKEVNNFQYPEEENNVKLNFHPLYFKANSIREANVDLRHLFE